MEHSGRFLSALSLPAALACLTPPGSRSYKERQGLGDRMPKPASGLNGKRVCLDELESNQFWIRTV
jgi:hypothetical protein